MPVTWWIVLLLTLPTAVLSAGKATFDEATTSMNSLEEQQADRAMKAVRPQESPDIVQRKVADFLDSYPGSSRRREVRNRLVEAYARTNRTAEAVDECMHMAFDLSGSQLGDQSLRDGWLQIASVFAKQGNWPAAAQMRVQVYLRHPYQLENRQQLSMAVSEMAKANRPLDVLAIGKLALTVLPEAESASILEAVKSSLVSLHDEQTAQRFEEYWQQGGVGNPLADVAIPGQDTLYHVAQADLANRGLLLGKPATAFLQRGILQLFAGNLPAAAQNLQNAVDASPPDQRDLVADQAGIYFRWIDGSAARARQYRSYVRWGKSGADGIAGTSDDLVNPFGELSTAQEQ